MKEYITDKAIVRIHPGKRTEEERKAAIEQAAQRFFKAIEDSRRKKGQTA